MKDTLLNKLEAIEYLVKEGPEYLSQTGSYNEWSEAGMFHAVRTIIESNKVIYDTKDLDVVIKLIP